MDIFSILLMVVVILLSLYGITLWIRLARKSHNKFKFHERLYLGFLLAIFCIGIILSVLVIACYFGG